MRPASRSATIRRSMASVPSAASTASTRPLRDHGGLPDIERAHGVEQREAARDVAVRPSASG